VDPVTERVVFEESARMLSNQDAVLTGLRARAGTLLAAAALVTAFLAPAALEMREERSQSVVRVFDWWASLATGSFVGVVGAALVVLWPYRWIFGHSAHDLMDHLLDANPPADEATVFRHLAYYNDVNHTSNVDRLKRLFFAFEIGCVLLGAEIALWLMALAT
jgi:hypothetical protein